MIVSARQTVGIVGGDGRTGGQFAALLRSRGFSVETTGRRTRQRNARMLRNSDIVLFAVPLRDSIKILHKEIVHCVRPDQLILDVCSLKVPQMRQMLKAKGEVIGMHPLFSPYTDPAGETIVVCPGRAKKETLASLSAVLGKMGLRVLKKSAAEHDHLMALIQAVPHFKSLLMADMLHAMRADLDEIAGVCTPVYEIEFNVIGRFLDDHADLYMPIIFGNPDTPKILRRMRSLLDGYIRIAESRDIAAASRRYTVLKRFFSSHARTARSRSEACIRTLSSLPA